MLAPMCPLPAIAASAPPAVIQAGKVAPRPLPAILLNKIKINEKRVSDVSNTRACKVIQSPALPSVATVDAFVWTYHICALYSNFFGIHNAFNLLCVRLKNKRIKALID